MYLCPSILSGIGVFTWYLSECLPGIYLSVYLVSIRVFTWYLSECLPGIYLSVHLVSIYVCIYELFSARCVNLVSKY